MAAQLKRLGEEGGLPSIMKKGKVIAYGNGGQSQDKHRKFVVHQKCWEAWAGKPGRYRASMDSVYFEGAENDQLAGRLCPACNKGWEKK